MQVRLRVRRQSRRTGSPRAAKIVSGPEDKPWKLREFTAADPDGNLIRVFYGFRRDIKRIYRKLAGATWLYTRYRVDVIRFRSAHCAFKAYPPALVQP